LLSLRERPLFRLPSGRIASDFAFGNRLSS
jgi:hypothetical protein